MFTQEMTNLARELLTDAKLKLADKEKLPESQDQMTAPVKKLAFGVSACEHHWLEWVLENFLGIYSQVVTELNE